MAASDTTTQSSAGGAAAAASASASAAAAKAPPSIPEISKEELASQLAKAQALSRGNNVDGCLAILDMMMHRAVETFGQLGHEVAPVYYAYGSALLLKVEQASDVFGATVKAKQAEYKKMKDAEAAAGGAAAAADGAAAASSSSSSSSSSSGAPPAPPPPAEDTGELLEISWESLEAARVIYTRTGGKNKEPQMALAKVYLRLGDLGTETGQFEQAVADYKQCLAIRETHLPLASRALADVHASLGVALYYSKQRKESLAAYQAAQTVLEACVEEKRQQLGIPAAPAVSGKGKGKAKAPAPAPAATAEDGAAAATPEMKELKDLEAVLEDIRERVKVETLAIASADSDADVLGAAAEAGKAAVADILGQQSGFSQATGSGAATSVLGAKREGAEVKANVLQVRKKAKTTK